MGDNLKSITNELILKYDKKFDEYYDKIVRLNSSIMNKEEIIIKENDEIKRKEKNISVLHISIIFVLLFSILLMSNAFKKIGLIQLIICTIILFIIYLIIISYFILFKTDTHKFLKSLDKIGSNMQKYVDNALLADLNLKCPATCNTNPVPVVPGSISGYESPTLRTDPQLNVWEYGDIPTDLYTTNKLPASTFYNNPTGIPNYTSTIEEEQYNQPKPFFKSNYPRSTYYECKWLGGHNNDGLPFKEKNKYSSIPCNYRPNYTLLNRYVCTRNPNNLSKNMFNDVCSEVSENTNIMDAL